MKKKLCWFSHNHNTPKGYVLNHISGKLTKAPKTRDILLLLQCSDCQHIESIFYKTVNADLAILEVQNLNSTLDLTSADIPSVNLIQGSIDCGF